MRLFGSSVCASRIRIHRVLRVTALAAIASASGRNFVFLVDNGKIVNDSASHDSPLYCDRKVHLTGGEGRRGTSRSGSGIARIKFVWRVIRGPPRRVVARDLKPITYTNGGGVGTMP